MAVSNALNSLNIDVQGQTEGVSPGLSAVERVITIRNRGSETANIELWLEPHDLKAEPLQRWASFDRSDSELVIDPNQEMDVQLSFAIPLQAEPGFYGYNLRIRSPQYPNQDIQRSQQLLVLQSDQELELRREPKFAVTPFTSSEQPHPIQVAETVEFTILVENPSRRTDRFFLVCRDLPKPWFTVRYPEAQGNIPGVVQESDGLELNPKESGEIRFQVHPPPYTPAGQYFPTIQLTSSNYSDYALLEIIYLQLQVDDRLTAELTPAERKIPVGQRQLTLTVTNQGNIHRALVFTLQDIDYAFHYRLKPSSLELQPGETAPVTIRFAPRRWINRLWHLREEVIQVEADILNQYRFDVEPDEQLTEAQQAELQESWEAATLPQPLSSKVTWRPQRRWLFILLLLTLGLTALTLVLSILWYLLIWRPSLRPRITLFDTTRGTYQEGVGQAVALNLEVTNPQNIGAIALAFDRQDPLRIFALEPAVPRRQNTASEDASRRVPRLPTLPQALLPYCSIEERPGRSRAWLTPLLRLNRIWRTGSPNEAYIRCRDLPPQGFQVVEGRYEFKLVVYSPSAIPEEDRPLTTAYIEDLEVIAPLAPTIVEFSPTAPEYRLVDNRPISLASPVTNTTGATTANGTSTEPFPTPPIRLNWQISNLADIESLRLSSRTPDGSAHSEDVIYRFDQGIPEPLADYCQDDANVLVCEAVPTDATTAGDYIFSLVLSSNNPNADETVVAKTPIIIIPPLVSKAPIILGFWVNGQSVADRPKQVYTINPLRESLDIVLSWQVDNAIRVELLPAPGIVEGNQLVYSLSAEPGAVSITLKAVNDAQDEISQTVVIEKVLFNQTSPSSTAGQQQGTDQPTSLTEPAPVRPPAADEQDALELEDDRLPAFELPPQPD